MEKQTIDQLSNIFFPESRRRKQALVNASKRFVHYTSAEAAMNILQKKEIWMREPMCMDDYTEIQHGINCVEHSYNSVTGKEFQAALNQIFDGVTAQVEQAFRNTVQMMKSETYLTCVSEHLADEDVSGRLSMWRAYSAGSGVAIVLNCASMLDGPGVLKIYTSPVEYSNPAQFEERMKEVTAEIKKMPYFSKL